MKSKVFKIALGICLGLIILATLIAANIHQSTISLKGVSVILNDDDIYSFLKKEDIQQLLLENRNLKIEDLNLDNVDLATMERIVRTNPWVQSADVFIDNKSILTVKVEQRIPIARIYSVNGESYYIDSVLQMMPPAAGYSFPTIVFSDVPNYKDVQRNENVLMKIRSLALCLNNDTFWSKQVTQVAMDDKEQFSIITRIGDQTILLGDTVRVKEKLDNVFAFYKQVATKLGWEKYEILDVRYKGQVVATPSLGWVAPKSKDTTIVLPDEVPSVNEIMNSLPEQPLIVKKSQPVTTKPEEPKPTVKVDTVKTKIKSDTSKKIMEPVAKVQEETKIKEKEKTNVASKSVATANNKVSNNKDVSKNQKETSKEKTTAPNSKEKEKSQEIKTKDKNQPKYIYPGQ